MAGSVKFQPGEALIEHDILAGDMLDPFGLYFEPNRWGVQQWKENGFSIRLPL